MDGYVEHLCSLNANFVFHKSENDKIVLPCTTTLQITTPIIISNELVYYVKSYSAYKTKAACLHHGDDSQWLRSKNWSTRKIWYSQNCVALPFMRWYDKYGMEIFQYRVIFYSEMLYWTRKRYIGLHPMYFFSSSIAFLHPI